MLDQDDVTAVESRRLINQPLMMGSFIAINAIAATVSMKALMHWNEADARSSERAFIWNA